MTFQTDLYDAMVADVVNLTKRPDLEEEIEIAVRTATTNCHMCDAFPRDAEQTVVQLPNASYLTSLDLPTLFPRVRGFSKILALDVDYNPVILTDGSEIEIIELGDIYDDYGSLKNNVAYQAGDKLNIRCLMNSYGYSVTWLRAPATRRADYSSWIAQLYPDVILYWAASIVLDTSGNEAKAAKYMKMTQDINLPLLRQNFLLGAQR